MTEEFTASNGTRIREDEWGYYEFTATGGAAFSKVERYPKGSRLDLAMAEYYRAREDERLGRWRWPENPDIYARPMKWDSDAVGIVKDDENGLAYGQYSRTANRLLYGTDPMSQAARVYFDAHPEPKPWHDAKPGEVWVITFSEPGGGTTEPWTMSKNGLFEHPNYGSRIRVKDSTIISARKIWPQDEPTVDDLSYDD